MNIHRLPTLCAVLVLAAGCAGLPDATQQTRILEVTRTTRLKDYAPDEQREEFYVVWSGSGVNLVKIEYRQVNAPNEVFAKSYVPTSRRWHVFVVGADEFRKNGKVSAWRVTLWQDGRLLAEQKSTLW